MGRGRGLKGGPAADRGALASAPGPRCERTRDCGAYAVLPIPCGMALTWFVGTIVEALVAGILVGLIVRNSPS